MAGARLPSTATPRSKRARTTQRAEPWAIDDYLSYLLARASHIVASEFHVEVRAAGLTVLEWRVLATLADGTARNVGTLASLALAQQSTVTKLLGRMEAEGRIVRADGEHDRRQSLVRITPAGRKALGTLLTLSKRHERLAVRGLLDQREAEALKSALRKLIAALDESGDPMTRLVRKMPG